MAYKEKIYSLRRTIEHEFTYLGNYGAKGEKRQKKVKPTPEQMEKQNQHNKERYVRRLILNNFDAGDCWATLKYPKGTRFTDASVMISDMRSFIRRMRNIYNKCGEEFRYIYRMEIGKQGAPHIHILMNHIRGKPMMKYIQDAWKAGHINLTPYEGDNGAELLAMYIAKKPTGVAIEQLSFFPEDDKGKYMRYQSSRNLVKPEPEVKEYSRRTLKKLIVEGPVPSAGYVIDKTSIECGTNPYTGKSYYRYREIYIEGGSSGGS